MTDYLKEDHKIELKSEWKDDCLKTICAFANTRGGTLIIGINDDGKILGVSNIQKLLEFIPNKIKSKLGIVADIKSNTIGDRNIIEITVGESSSTISYNGKYYKRSGSNTFVLNGEELRRFLLSRSTKNEKHKKKEDKGMNNKRPGILLEDSIKLGPNEEWHEEFELKKGDVITITLTGNSDFFADFCTREEYVKRYGDMFSFPIASDRKAYTGKIKISEDDDYYLVLRRSLWRDDPVKVRVKVRCDRSE